MVVRGQVRKIDRSPEFAVVHSLFLYHHLRVHRTTLGIRRGGLMNLEDECDAEVRIGLIIVDYLSMGWHKPR